MGIFDKLFGKKKITSEIVQELLTLKSKISELPQKYQTNALTFGAGVGKAQEQIPTLCAIIDDFVSALKTGLDRHNKPITKPYVASELKRLVAHTRQAAFIGLVSTVLNPTGVNKLEKYMNELEQIASKIK